MPGTMCCWGSQNHPGRGLLQEPGEPTVQRLYAVGQRLYAFGMTRLHIKDGKIVDKWNVWDELLLAQLKPA